MYQIPNHELARIREGLRAGHRVYLMTKHEPRTGGNSWMVTYQGVKQVESYVARGYEIEAIFDPCDVAPAHA